MHHLLLFLNIQLSNLVRKNGCLIVPIVTPHLSKSQAPREHRAEKQDSADASTNISFP